jgi:hypothetical protein
MPNGHGWDGELSGKVEMRRRAASFHFFDQELISITPMPALCREAR